VFGGGNSPLPFERKIRNRYGKTKEKENQKNTSSTSKD
jgi:hypothetical protein